MQKKEAVKAYVWILGAVLSAPACAFAADAPSAQAAPDAAAAPASREKPGVLREVWGEVDHVGKDMKSIFIRDKKGGVHEMKVDAATTVSAGADGHAVAVSELKKGDKVRVRASKDGARDVEVLLVPAAPSRRQLLEAEMAHPRRFSVVSRLQGQGFKIMDDVAAGTLDSRQARKLIARLDGIREEERDSAAKHGGHLDAESYAKLQQELNGSGGDRHDEAMGTQAKNN